VRPDPRDADELHDVLITAGFLTQADSVRLPQGLFDALTAARRSTRLRSLWVAAERVPEMRAVHLDAGLDPPISVPPSRASRTWARDQAIVELLRGRLSITGPTTANELARALEIDTTDAQAALMDLESQGIVLRGRFTGGPDLEFCDRALLARIHRYTLNRLRAEIEPVSPADFMRFLLVWQHVDESHRLTGAEGLRAIVERLDGFEVPAKAWERAVLPARLDRYQPSMLDLLCLTGQVGWGRLPVASSPAEGPAGRGMRVALFLRDHADAWRALRSDEGVGPGSTEEGLNDACRRVLDVLRSRGASFFPDLVRSAELDVSAVAAAIASLAAQGLVTSDGFAGVRAVARALTRTEPAFERRSDAVGRWSALPSAPVSPAAREHALEMHARALLTRYGVVFRRLLARETNAATWRELTMVYRRLEARGEIRGGRFVTGVSGEQFASADAVERLREIRRSKGDSRLITISAADPLNLVGILTSGDRVRAVTSSRIVYRDGVALAALEGDYLRPLAEIEAAAAGEIATALAGRPVPAVTSGFIGR
jgi:ATP-dependent Lhr-like helicase